VKRLAIISSVLVAMAGSAAAQPAATTGAALEPAPLDSAVSVPLDPLLALAGIAGEYERQRDRWSGSVSGALASYAGGDYGSTTLAAGIEVRYWFKRSAIWSAVAPGTMVGWFAGARFDTAAVRTVDRMEDRTLATTVAFEVTVRGGYRFAPWRRLLVTPSLGLGSRTEVDPGGRIPSWRRGVLSTQLAVGWLF
jgi:hypothetical protein